MRIGVDTNVLVRLVVGDDRAQQRKAVAALDAAELVAVGTHVFCEVAWVLERGYGVRAPDVAAAIRGILDMRNVVVDRPAVEAGLAVLDAGGDFADGVIAFDGRRLGGSVFVSFDRRAVELLDDRGLAAALLR